MTKDEATKLLTATRPRDDFGDFCAVLVEGGSLVDPEDILDYIRKPWKWSPEYAAWANAGRPQPEEEGWDKFADALNRLLLA